jgi:uncharacterized protein (DUF1330 family)
MNTLQSNADQFKQLNANPSEAPVTMLNLLKFKKDGGRQNYLRYVKESGPFIESVGAKVTYLAKTAELLNGSETWDLVMLVTYPSRKAFIKMTNDPEYLKVHEYREAAVERAVLYATDEMTFREILKGNF